MAKKAKKYKEQQQQLLLEAVIQYFKLEPRALHNYKQVCAAIGVED